VEVFGVAGLGALGQTPHGRDEAVEFGFALALRRLHQQRTVHDQRKIHGHGVEALVDQRLRIIEGTDAGVLEEAVVEQRLVHAGAGKGRREIVLGRGEDIVGVEDGILRDLA